MRKFGVNLAFPSEADALDDLRRTFRTDDEVLRIKSESDMWQWLQSFCLWLNHVMKPKPHELTFDDFIIQMKHIADLGPPSRLMRRIPGMQDFLARNMMDDSFFEQVQRDMLAVYASMSCEERRNPDILNGSRRRRIADGAGVRTVEVASVMRQFMMFRETMRRVHEQR